MLLAGSILDRAPGRTYTGALRFAELALRNPLPRANTLASWRGALPEGFAIALRAPRSSLVSARGPLRFDDALEASLQWVIDAAQALNVRAVVLPTPADLTPGARSRELLAAYVARLPRVESRHYVWAPSGVWEPEDSDPVCEQLGLVRAFDPLETQRPKGDVVYATLRAMGHRSSFSQAALEDAFEVIGQASTSEAFVSVDAERGFDVAKRIQRLMSELLAAADAEEAEGDELDGDEPDESDESDEDESDDQDGADDEDAETLDDTP